MKKILMGTLLALGLSPSIAFSSDITACSGDEYSRERITEWFNEQTVAGKKIELLEVKNAKDEIVGVIYGNEKEYYSAYLCGSNSGYYYVESTLEDIVNKSLVMYNDEYDVSVGKTNYNKKTNSVSFEITIKFSGEEEDADYEVFTDNIIVDLEPKTVLPQF